MSSYLVTVVATLAVLAAVVVLLVLRPHRRRTAPAPAGDRPGLDALRRRVARGRWVGLAAGAVAFGVVAALPGGLGRGLALAPLAGATVVVVALVTADLAARGTARGQRAGLGARRGVATPPRGITLAAALCLAALVVVLALAAGLGSADDLGRAGRSLSYTTPDGGGSAGPWPGTFYSSVLAPALALLAALTLVGLVVVARRPRDDSDGEIVRVDDWIRRRQAESLVAAAGLGVALEAMGVLATAGLAARSVALGSTEAGVPQPWLTALGWACLLGVPIAAVLAIWCAVLLLVPGARPPRGARSASVLAAPPASTVASVATNPTEPTGPTTPNGPRAS
ncbi:hypothetical protein [Agilicoccus flavus]|uniref:hypothetical protein n=1 Tax=Agilicoccus flavus TaxID=2775968 RepID=UPI001CF64D49|nr:hypothetical protein [Agilicoccus flavus]